METMIKSACIQLSRSILNWEWYGDIKTKILFLHCLLKANIESGSWHGIQYEAGQFITSLRQLEKETGLTPQEIRTALKHLKQSGDITDIRQGNNRIITVNNRDLFITPNIPVNTPSTKEKRVKTKDPKSKYGEYGHVMLTDAERDRLFNDYGESDTLAAIKYLDEYIEMKGKKYNNHNLVLRKWVFDAIKKNKNTSANRFDAWAKA